MNLSIILASIYEEFRFLLGHLKKLTYKRCINMCVLTLFNTLIRILLFHRPRVSIKDRTRESPLMIANRGASFESKHVVDGGTYKKQ